MKQPAALFLAVVLMGTLPLFAQRPEQRPAPRPEQQHNNRPRANQGRIPPPPSHAPRREREPERFDGGRMNDTPHVNHDHWYGHERADDRRFVLSRPFEHGRFQHIGPSYRYRFLRVDPGLHRLFLPGGFAFAVAAWDWPLCADWCWDCDDDFVVYDDPDHPGWYLVYNIHTGVYVHAQYMGP